MPICVATVFRKSPLCETDSAPLQHQQAPRERIYQPTFHLITRFETGRLLRRMAVMLQRKTPFLHLLLMTPRNDDCRETHSLTSLRLSVRRARCRLTLILKACPQKKYL